MLQLAMDANFRLRSKLRGASSQDPTLGPGWSYFVNYLPYSEFIKNYVDEEEVCMHYFLSKQATDCRIAPDTHLRGISGIAEHADKEIEGFKGDGTGSCQLCTAPTISPTRSGRPSERRTVRMNDSQVDTQMLITIAANVTLITYSVQVL